MAFQKPLKVFLSHSHDEDPQLFQDLKNQLQALCDDNISQLWDDRIISAGQDWDLEIKSKLNDCHLFIALTSASFNASGYIRGIEMATAWQRHTAGLCRIIPIMWRQWRPPERLRSLQFIPGLDSDVTSAKNRDDA